MRTFEELMGHSHLDLLSAVQQLEAELDEVRPLLRECLAMAEAWEDSDGGRASELIIKIRAAMSEACECECPVEGHMTGCPNDPLNKIDAAMGGKGGGDE